MAQRGDPELAQVVRGQRREDHRVDVVVAERLRVLTEAETLEPSRDVHVPSPEQVPPPTAGRRSARTITEHAIACRAPSSQEWNNLWSFLPWRSRKGRTRNSAAKI